jgi:hypothetical protein
VIVDIGRIVDHHCLNLLFITNNIGIGIKTFLRKTKKIDLTQAIHK